MEPSEFDDLIKNKLAGENPLHTNEIEHSRAFVWSSIQQNLKAEKSWNWKPFMAAAVFAFLILSTVIFHYKLENQNNEAIQLSKQMLRLNKQFGIQTTLLVEKNQKINRLQNELNGIKAELKQLNNQPVLTPKIVYQTDTVFLKNLNEVAQTPNIADSTTSVNTEPNKTITPELEGDDPQEKETNKIYPSYVSTQKLSAPNETIKVKFASFVSN